METNAKISVLMCTNKQIFTQNISNLAYATLLQWKRCIPTSLIIWKLTLFFAMGFFLNAMAIAKENHDKSHLQIDFTDHTHVHSMKQEWIDKKIKYEEGMESSDLVISLGQQTYHALHDMIEKLAKRRNLNVIVHSGSCGKTSKKLRRKSIDIGAYCCPPMKGDRLPGLEFHTVGIAPLAFLVNPSNALDNLSSDDALAIYNGTYIKWSEVPSGNKKTLLDELIKPVIRLHCKKRPGHWKSFIESEDKMSTRLYEVGITPDLINIVASDEKAIGIETVMMKDIFKKNRTLKVLKVNGHKPDDVNPLLKGEYPAYRTFNLTTWTSKGKNRKLAKDFVKEIIEYVNSTPKTGFVSPKQLKDAGWKFHKNELIANPQGFFETHKH